MASTKFTKNDEREFFKLVHKRLSEKLNDEITIPPIAISTPQEGLTNMYLQAILEENINRAKEYAMDKAIIAFALYMRAKRLEDEEA